MAQTTPRRTPPSAKPPADVSGRSGSLVVMLLAVQLIGGVQIWMGRRTQQQLGGDEDVRAQPRPPAGRVMAGVA